MSRHSRLETHKTRPSKPASIRDRGKSIRAANGSQVDIGQIRVRARKPLTPKSAKDRYKDLRHKANGLSVVIQQQKFCINRPGNVPSEHGIKFKDIQTLGQYTYSSYGLQPSPETTYKPWQRENKQRARTLNCLAIKCREERLNEAGWRMNVEFRLFQRFEVEVACKRCRKRNWQSEIEVDPSNGNSRTTSLKDRQARREPCKCDPDLDLNDVGDTCLSDIFSSRIQEPNTLLPDDKYKSEPTRKEPDRVHGLQSTKYFEKLLQQECGAQSQRDSEPPQKLADILQTSCNPDCGGKSLRFPFLVMEAKSGKGGSNFDEIEIQTALPIRNLLILQHKLHNAEFNNLGTPGGPLAWFFANVGEMWRVYGCYVTLSGDAKQPSWNIVLLWEGSITGLDEALQLVLIVDYILDWARDIYRPSIIRQLKCVATKGARPAYTVSNDSEIFSLAERPRGVASWLRNQVTQEPTPTVLTRGPTESQVLLANDFHAAAERRWNYPIHSSRDKHSWARYGTVLVSRVRGLWITADNLETLLQGFSDEKTKNSFVSDICGIVKVRARYFVLPNAQALSIAEQVWTDDSTYCASLHNSTRPTLVSLQVRFWVSESWELMRELTYMAITDEAYDQLLPSEKRQELGLATDWKFVEEGALVNLIERENNKFKDDFFLRCLEQQVLVLHHVPCMKFRPDARFQCSTGRLGKLVSSIYKTYQRGIRRPMEPFIRDIDASENILPGSEHPIWSTNQHGVLVSGGLSGLCLYVTNRYRAKQNNKSSWLFQNLANRLTLNELIFKARIGKTKAGPNYVSLGSDHGVLTKLAEWIISEQPTRMPMDLLKDDFPDMELFRKLMLFEQIYSNGEEFRFVEFSWNDQSSESSAATRVSKV